MKEPIILSRSDAEIILSILVELRDLDWQDTTPSSRLYGDATGAIWMLRHALGITERDRTAIIAKTAKGERA